MKQIIAGVLLGIFVVVLFCLGALISAEVAHAFIPTLPKKQAFLASSSMVFVLSGVLAFLASRSRFVSRHRIIWAATFGVAGGALMMLLFVISN